MSRSWRRERARLFEQAREGSRAITVPESPVPQEPPREALVPAAEPEEAVAGATRRKEKRRRRRRSPQSAGPDLVGRDFAGQATTRRSRRRPRLLAPLVSGALAAMLLLAALHLDLIRLKYALGEALRTETELQGALGQRVVDERGLRDPAELHRRAEEMGLGVAEQVIALPVWVARQEDER